MKEVAKQELKLLEAQHPTRFHYLKLQLKEFILLLDEQDHHQSSYQKQQQQQHSYTSIITQESSSLSRRKRGGAGVACSTSKERRDEEGISDAIHKAETCLHKIQTLKLSFFCSSTHH